MIRRDEYFERFREITTERGWSEHQQIFVGSIAIRGFGSTEKLVELTEQILQIEDGLAAERGETVIQYENVFNRAGIIRKMQAGEQAIE
jgi:hypothetical protein